MSTEEPDMLVPKLHWISPIIDQSTIPLRKSSSRINCKHMLLEFARCRMDLSHSVVQVGGFVHCSQETLQIPQLRHP